MEPNRRWDGDHVSYFPTVAGSITFPRFLLSLSLSFVYNLTIFVILHFHLVFFCFWLRLILLKLIAELKNKTIKLIMFHFFQLFLAPAE